MVVNHDRYDNGHTDEGKAFAYLSDGVSPATVRKLLFENRYVRTFVADRKFDQGYFMESLCLDKDERLKPGPYRVDIYLHRNKLGSTEFFVTAGEP